MHRPIALLVFVLVLAWPGLAATADAGVAPPGTDWMTVLLGGRKIGHIEVTRERSGDVLTTTQTLSVNLSRAGQPLRLDNMIRSVEGPAGQPLGFAARTRMSVDASTVDGQRDDDGRYRVTTTVGGRSHAIVMDWPAGALLAEGQRQATVAAGRHVGSNYQLRQFDPSSQQVIDVDVVVLGDETVVLPGGPQRLSHQRQTLELAQGSQVMDVWLDDRGIARKGLMHLLGQPLEMLACDQACALAPDQGVDMLRAATVPSPRRLPASFRSRPLRYRIHAAAGIAQPLLATDEQQVTALGHDEWQLDIGTAHGGQQAPPQPGDSAATAWLQSDAPAIRQLAIQAVGNAGSDRARMRRLRAFVSGYITGHGLDVGYASALEVLRSRQGDCTEYAVLLAALARSQGIPARVVVGMVYADRFAGADQVFVPHEWVQAWIDGRWQSYDAALRQFDTTHIALASGDGDPWHFAAATRMFGNLRIDAVTPADGLLDMPVPSAAAPPGNGGGHGG